MSPDEVAEKVLLLRRYSRRIPDPSMSNYKMVLASYKKVLDEMLELMGEIAAHTHIIVDDVEFDVPKEPIS